MIQNIIKYTTFLTILCISSTCLGGSSITIPNGLDDEQKAILALDAAKMATKNKTTTINSTVAEITQTKVADVKEWAELINAIGDGMVNIATKTGVAVNDFSNSKVGTITMFIMAWSYLGKDLVGIIVGLMWLIFMVPAWLYCYRRSCLVKKISYYDKSNSIDGLKKSVTFQSAGDNSGTTLFYLGALILISVSGLSCIF